MAEKDFRVQKGLIVANGDVTVPSSNSVFAGTFDTNVAAAGVTLTGTTLAADGTDTNINIAITPKGSGEVDISKVDIDGGTIDGATIATSDITVGTGKTLDVSGGTLTLANDQISGDKISGGTIGTTTITALAGNLSLGDNNITNVGDIALDSISADGNDIDITLTDNRAASLQIKEGSNVYMAFNTADTNGELIELGKDLQFEGTANHKISIEPTSGTNQTGRDLTFEAGTSTGNVLGGEIVFKVGGAAGSSGSTATTLTTALTLTGAGVATIPNVDINGGAIDGTAIGANSQSTAKVTTLETTSHARINGNARETNTLLQVNGDLVSAGGNLGGGGSAATADTNKYAEVRIHSDIANDDLAGMHVEHMGGVYIIDNAENAPNTGQGSIYTVGRSGSGDAWGAGRQATTGKYAIGYINSDYDGKADSSENPMRTGQAVLEIDTSGNTTLTQNGAYFAFTGATSGAAAREIRFRASTNGMTATGDETYVLPVSFPPGDRVLQSNSTGGLSWVAQSGGTSVSGTDNRMVRMDGTTGLQDTGITIDDSNNITGIASLTASATVTAADLTATDDITVGDDLITSDGSVIRPVSKSGTNVTGNTLQFKSGQGTGTGSSRIDFFTKSADGSGSTDSFTLSNTIVMKDGRLGIGSGVASDVSGNIITHPLTVAEDTDAEFVAMALSNRSDSNNTNGSVSMLFNLEDTGGNTVDSGKIKVVKNEAFTATGTTQDSNMEFYTSLNGTLTKRMEVLSDGAKVTGDLAVTGDLNITGDINSVSVTNLDVDDLTITLAKGAADSAAADGAGFSIDGASASMLYSDSGTKFTINKPLDITGALNVTGTLTGDTSLTLDTTTITTAEIGVLDSVTAGTATANKALVVDGSKDIGTLGTLTAATITANTTINTPSLSVDSVAVIDTSSSNSQSFAGSAIDLFTYAYGTYRTAKLVGHIHNTSTHETDAFEILVTYDGDTGPSGSGATDVHMTTYAYISSNDTPMGTLAAVKSGSNIAVQFTNTVSNFTGAFSVTATQLIKQ